MRERGKEESQCVRVDVTVEAEVRLMPPSPEYPKKKKNEYQIHKLS